MISAVSESHAMIGRRDLFSFRDDDLHAKLKIFRRNDIGDFQHITLDDFPLLEIRPIRSGRKRCKAVGDAFGKKKHDGKGL